MVNIAGDRLTRFNEMRVLVLDDVAPQRAAVTQALGKLGVTDVVCAANCREALKLFEDAGDFRFDAVLCSLDMVSKDSECLMRNAPEQRIDGYVLMTDFADEMVATADALEQEYKVNLLGLVPKSLDVAMLGDLLRKRQLSNDPASQLPLPPAPRAWTFEELESALRAGQFVPYYQPKIELKSGKPVGVEVLARWNHPEYGMLSPVVFIEAMEKTGLVDELFNRLFSLSLGHAEAWMANKWDIGMAINASPRTLQNVALPDQLKTKVEQHGICAHSVTIEITETASASDADGIESAVCRLRAHGFKISVDDFGTGFSGLQQLSALPFTELKIDRSFVAGMMEKEKSVAILESIVGLANRLCLNTVAEGIETKGELEFIQSLGCRVGQAFFFAKPMPQDELISYLRTEFAGAALAA